MRWAEHIAHTEGMRNVYIILVGKLKGKIETTGKKQA
jgi:hypothetical protein